MANIGDMPENGNFGPNMAPGFTQFSAIFFSSEKAVPQTFSLLEWSLPCVDIIINCGAISVLSTPKGGVDKAYLNLI